MGAAHYDQISAELLILQGGKILFPVPPLVQMVPLGLQNFGIAFGLICKWTSEFLVPSGIFIQKC